ncbi:response regulator transcription factor [Streptomyces angustmyceticus]|uniref:response regulator transcription factor n=1 Tax=Streptomyces angustmyceticus TaxID=285578 RepID=UPI0036B2DAB0
MCSSVAAKSAEVWAESLRRVGELTSRELEVFALLSQGSSNQELADALFVSERTIRAHLSSISAKLRLASRLQLCLASHAHTHGCRSAEANIVANDNSDATRSWPTLMRSGRAISTV